MGWSQFYWMEEKIDVNYVEKKAALIVPVSISGCTEKLYAQLDTGAPKSIIYAPVLRQLSDSCKRNIDTTSSRTYKITLGIDPKEEWTMQEVQLIFSLGNASSMNVKMSYTENFGDGDSNFGEGENKGLLIGTIGLDVFEDKQLVIDFPRERFLVLDKDEPLPKELAAQPDYSLISIRNGHIYLPISINGTLIEAFFDTGSSIFPLIVTKELWKLFTGKIGDEITNTRIEVPAWGKLVTLVGARLYGEISIGKNLTWDSDKSNIEIFYIDSKNETPSFIVIGNALFFNDYTIILDFYKKRFGLMHAH